MVPVDHVLSYGLVNDLQAILAAQEPIPVHTDQTSVVVVGAVEVAEEGTQAEEAMSPGQPVELATDKAANPTVEGDIGVLHSCELMR